MNDIEELREIILRLHGSESTHIETVPIKETFQGKTLWEGHVEVFDLINHPKAPRVYAWTHETGDPSNPRRTLTVLHIRPALSPQKAVQVVIASEYRDRLAE